MKLYFVRHGKTQWNIDGYMQGRSDIPLCDIGRQQARDTEKLLADKHIDICISSPLSRARETAEIILKGRDVPIITDERIIERAFGSYEGSNAFYTGTEEYRKTMWNLDGDGKFDDMEPIGSVVKRVYAFLDDIKEKYKDKSVLITAHGGLSPAVKYYIAGQEISENYLFDIVKNCEIIEGEI